MKTWFTMGITIKRISVIASVLTLSTLTLTASLYSFSSSFFLFVDAQKDQKPQVKITYPDADQHIPSGKLTIYGTSSDSHLTFCQVFVLLNDERPYQNATATSRGGKDDYSKWTFTFDPYYSLIREGTNELVSKVICHYNDGTNSTSHNKINVTGVGSARTELINQSQQATGIVPSPPPSTSGAPLLSSAAPTIVSPAQEKQQEYSSPTQVPTPEEETNRITPTTEAKEEICDNGIDDDDDSLVDVDDSGDC
ncbi:MAG: hypothetical protein ACR2IS_01790, partial [Nitrososphaeraceae archaeon]